MPTLDGTETVKVPEGTQTGTTMQAKGKGLPDVNGRGKGDLFATVQVQTPKKLNKEQRQLLEQLAKALPKEKFEPRPHAETHGRTQPLRSRQGHVRVSEMLAARADLRVRHTVPA